MKKTIGTKRHFTLFNTRRLIVILISVSAFLGIYQLGFNDFQITQAQEFVPLGNNCFENVATGCTYCLSGCGAVEDIYALPAGCCWNSINVDVSCPPDPPACDECGSCADHRYRWCTGGSFGGGTCVDSTCGVESYGACDADLCGGGPPVGGGPGGPPPPPPPSADLMGPAVIEVPNPVILSWNSSNADSCSASGDWSGVKPTSGSETLNLPRGAYTFTLNCSGPGGSVSDSVTVNIIQAPQCTFWPDPSSIIIPQTSSLRWTCQYADSCSIDQGVGSVCVSETECSSDLTKVRPKQTTAYVLTCGGLDGSRSYSATVNVGFIPKLKEIIPKLNFWYNWFGV